MKELSACRVVDSIHHMREIRARNNRVFLPPSVTKLARRRVKGGGHASVTNQTASHPVLLARSFRISKACATRGESLLLSPPKIASFCPPPVRGRPV